MKPARPKTVPYRRRRTLRTNYSKRLNLLLSGKPRLIVRLTNTQIIAQVATFSPQGDVIAAAVAGKDLHQLGWNYSCKNMPAAYLTGLLIGKGAMKKGVKECILDTGNVTPLHKSRLYAFLKGVIDAGLDIPHNDEKDIFPSDERISGKHIVAFAQLPQGKSGLQHAQYLKSKALPEKITEQFLLIKKKING